MDYLANVYWIVALVEQTISVILYIPAIYYYVKYREEHHMITKSFLLLVIPDIILLINYFPLHIAALVDGETLPGPGCSFSAMVIIGSIVASNVGSVVIAATTKRMLDITDRAVTGSELIIWGLVGWVAGLLMGGGYAAGDQLGPHRNLYCCMKNGYSTGTALPTFFVYGFAITAMFYYYRKAILQVKDAVESTASKTTQPASNASKGLLRRALLISSIYYFTWSLVALLGALEWAGVEYNRWWDAVAAWQIKAGPILDALLLLWTVRRVHAQKVANKQRGSAAYDNRRNESSNRASDPSSAGPAVGRLRIAATDSPLSPVRGLQTDGNTAQATPERMFNARQASSAGQGSAPATARQASKPLLATAESREAVPVNNTFDIRVEPAVPGSPPI